jgi:hypothetical protein
MKWRPLLILGVVFLLVVAALAVLQAVRPKPGQKPPAPLSYAQTTPAAKVELKIDPKIARYPFLADKLYRDGLAELKSFAAQAAEDQQRLAAKGLPVRPYQRSIAWSLAAATPDLVSVKEAWSDDTGGAHPNHGANGLLWDARNDREVTRSELLRPGADLAVLDGVLCEAIKAEKARRDRAAPDDQSRPCPKWADADLVLSPSPEKGKAAGLVFLFDPYSIGAYAEGDYEVPVPAASFRADVSPAWAQVFVDGPSG